ncbi:MAG: ankyrin repeat domain-containing protein [Pseudomonadota bacterium]
MTVFPRRPIRIALVGTLAFVLINSSVACQEIDEQEAHSTVSVEAMKSSEERFNRRQKKRVIRIMSADDLYPDLLSRQLAIAAGKNNRSAIDKLIDSGASVNGTGYLGTPILYWPMRNNNLAGFTYLLEKGADPDLLFGDQPQKTLVNWAVKHRNLDFLRVILDQGGDPNGAIDQAGSEVRLNLYVQDLFGEEPPLAGRQEPIFELVLRPGGGKNKALDILAKSGADLEARNHLNQTIVLAAALHQDYSLVRRLLQLDVDRSLTDSYGNSLETYVSRFLDENRKWHPEYDDAVEVARLLKLEERPTSND